MAQPASRGVPADAREVYHNELGEPIAWCPADSLGLTDLARAGLFRLNHTRLREMAASAARKGLSPEVAVLVCIDVDDPTWKFLVDALMPGHDWEAIRARGELPVARGSAMREGVEGAAMALYPACKGELEIPLPVGVYRGLIFAAGGVSAVHIEPMPEAGS